MVGKDVVISDALVTRDTLSLPVVVEEQGLSVMAVLQVYKVRGPLIFPPTSAVPPIMVRIGHTWFEFGFFLENWSEKGLNW